MIALHQMEADGLNQRLLEEVLALWRTEPSADRSLSGEWRSRHDLFQRNGACEKLCRTILKLSDGIVADGWINVNPPGAFNAPHCHPNARIAGVYYVATPEGCGDLELLNGPKRRSLAPQAGMFVLFPADIYHWVCPNKSSELRVSISWNVK
jgi:hypothetical protein